MRKVRIVQDLGSESPREWGTLSKIVCWHKRYHLGDEHEFSSPQEFLNAAKKNKWIVFPLYTYDHGNIAFSLSNLYYPFNCPWDAGQIGWVYVTPKDIREWFNIKNITKKVMNDVEEVIIGELKTYEEYLAGEVYGYEILEPCDECGHYDVIESCFGFYGSNPFENGMREQIPEELWEQLENIEVTYT